MTRPGPVAGPDRALDAKPERRGGHFDLPWRAGAPRIGLEILVAGCGTSQAARHALREPDARVTAIDVSEASLRHTSDLKQKYNLNNLELHHLPIERVGELERSFDLIACTHLPPPLS